MVCVCVCVAVCVALTERVCRLRALREHLAQHATIAERLLAGKLAKPQFVEQEAQLNRKKEEAVQRMEAVVASL